MKDEEKKRKEKRPTEDDMWCREERWRLLKARINRKYAIDTQEVQKQKSRFRIDAIEVLGNE